MASNDRRQTGRTRGGDLRGRAFSWYWRRLSKRFSDPVAFNGLVLARRAELDELVRRTEAKIAGAQLTPISEGDAIWRCRPDCMNVPLSPSTYHEPVSGISFGDGLGIFHDDKGGVFTLTQRPSGSAKKASRFEAYFESYEFDGTYLSLALAIPDDVRRPVQGEQIVLSIDLGASRLMKSFARLNIQNARGKDTLYAEAELGGGAHDFVFDLSFTTFEAQQNDTMWVDLILDRPRMVEFSIRALDLSLRSKDRA